MKRHGCVRPQGGPALAQRPHGDRLIVRDGIEERILNLHRDKRDLASELLEGADTAERLSEEALLDLIRA